MQIININCKNNYKVYLSNKLLDDKAIINYCANFAKIGIFIDQNIPESLVNELIENLNINSIDCLVFKIAICEKIKNRDTKNQLEDLLFANNFNKNSLIIAVGGGVLLDLVGFVAATFMRGVPVLYFPTSLLAMLDATVGGKTAVNTEFGKNTIGIIKQPLAVFIDLRFLESLPDLEYNFALVEAVKHGLILDKNLLEFIDNNSQAILKRDLQLLIEFIAQNIKIKAKIIEQDEFEQNLRQILNFGHTVGHAIEALTNFTINHGQAVLLGILLESNIALKRGYLSKSEYQAIINLFGKLNVRVKLTDYIKNHPSFNFFKNIIYLDKKTTGNSPKIILLESIGKVASTNFCQELTISEIKYIYRQLFYFKYVTQNKVAVLDNLVFDKINQAYAGFEYLELRIDLLANPSLDKISDFFNEVSKIVIFTIRKDILSTSDLEFYLNLAKKLPKTKDFYFDLDLSCPKAWFGKFKAANNKLKLICSYHNYQTVPKVAELAKIYNSMQNKYIDLYKIIGFANNYLEARRALKLLRLASSNNLIAHAMGEYGIFTRKLAAKYGSKFAYYGLTQNNLAAPGILTGDFDCL